MFVEIGPEAVKQTTTPPLYFFVSFFFSCTDKITEMRQRKKKKKGIKKSFRNENKETVQGAMGVIACASSGLMASKQAREELDRCNAGSIPP